MSPAPTTIYTGKPTYEVLIIPDLAGTSFRMALVISNYGDQWTCGPVDLDATEIEAAKAEGQVKAREFIRAMNGIAVEDAQAPA